MPTELDLDDDDFEDEQTISSPSRSIALPWIAHARSGLWTRQDLLDRWIAAIGLPEEQLAELAQALVETWPLSIAQDAAEHTLADWLRQQPAFVPLSGWHLQDRLRSAPALSPLVRAAPKLAHVPRLSNIEELAALLRSDPGELLWLSGRFARGPERYQHYRTRLIAKADGSPRLLEIPKARLKLLQQHILRKLLNPIELHPAAKGYVRGRGVLDHARTHVGARSLLRMDLRDWFLSIAFARVRAQFLRMGMGADLGTLLAQLCTVRTPVAVARQLSAVQQNLCAHAHLPQGAPTSPALSNLVAARLDIRLNAYAAASGWRYSRYADDLVLSSQQHERAALRSALPSLQRIVESEGFVLQHHKTALIPAHQQQRVTGIVTNERPNLDRRTLDQLRAELHAWTCGREHLAPGQSRTQAFNALRGRVAWVLQVHPRRGARLHEYLRCIET